MTRLNELRQAIERNLPSRQKNYEIGNYGIFYNGERIPISRGGGINSYGTYSKALHSLYNVANLWRNNFVSWNNKEQTLFEYKQMINELIKTGELEIKQI